MAGMSRDVLPSAFIVPWCAKQSVARPIDVCACVQRCSWPRHGHLRYEVAVAVAVCVTVVIGVRGARHSDSPEVVVVKEWWCGVDSRP
jgi:predicted exporter